MRALNELLHGPLDGGGGSVHGPVRHHRRCSAARHRRRVARRRLGGGFEAPRRESLPCALAKHNEMKMRSPPGPHSYTCLSLSVVVMVAPLPPPPGGARGPVGTAIFEKKGSFAMESQSQSARARAHFVHSSPEQDCSWVTAG